MVPLRRQWLERVTLILQMLLLQQTAQKWRWDKQQEGKGKKKNKIRKRKMRFNQIWWSLSGWERNPQVLHTQPQPHLSLSGISWCWCPYHQEKYLFPALLNTQKIHFCLKWSLTWAAVFCLVAKLVSCMVNAWWDHGAIEHFMDNSGLFMNKIKNKQVYS